MASNETTAAAAAETDGEATPTDSSAESWQLAAAVASSALAPYVAEATEAAADWVVARWPEYVGNTLLPALADAVRKEDGADGDAARAVRSRPSPQASRSRNAVRAGLIAGAVGTVLGAAGVVFARR
jgi:hypothetical protein